MTKIVVILDSCWRDDSYFTFIDNLNHIVNVNLAPSSNQTHLQILNGHDVIVMNSYDSQGEVNSVAWTNDHRILITGAEDGIIKVLKMD